MPIVITAGKAGAGDRSTVPPVMFALHRASQTIADTTTEAVSTVIGKQGETVAFYATTVNVGIAVAVGSNPDADTAYQHIAYAGTPAYFFCEDADTRFSVKTAS